jgi:TetR/AcrR family transcriptional repressor of mexJK operon
MARPSKRDAILKVAGDLFVAHGFHKVSVDQIVAAVPISRPTLYAHFKDKRALYSAVIGARCQRLLATLRDRIDNTQTPEETLFAIGYEFLGILLSDSAIHMHRTLAAEAEESPEIAELFYESGPKQMLKLVTDYLAHMHKQKKLHVTDPALSADMFLGMIKGYAHLRCILGIAKPLGKKQMRARVAYAVDIMMKAHACA